MKQVIVQQTQFTRLSAGIVLYSTLIYNAHGLKQQFWLSREGIEALAKQCKTYGYEVIYLNLN